MFWSKRQKPPDILHKLDNEGKVKWEEYRSKLMEFQARFQELRKDIFAAREANDFERMGILRNRGNELRMESNAVRREAKAFLESHGIDTTFMEMHGRQQPRPPRPPMQR